MPRNLFATRLKASELRIGNFVRRIDEPDSYVLVTGLMIMQLQKAEELKGKIENMQGIPLTIEWMRAFNFSAEDLSTKRLDEREHGILAAAKFSKTSCSPGCIEVSFVSDLNPTLGQLDGITLDYNKTSIQKIHQLQNLYFALTGEELTLNHSE